MFFSEKQKSGNSTKENSIKRSLIRFYTIISPIPLYLLLIKITVFEKVIIVNLIIFRWNLFYNQVQVLANSNLAA